MNIFLRELKAHRKAIIIWSISIVLFIIAGMVRFDSFKGSTVSINEVVAAMPKSIRVLFGLNSMDMSTPKGYFGLLYFYLILMAAIHAAMLGSNIISKEERDKTSEFLMAKPVSRNKIITAKLLAALFNIVIFNLVSLVSSVEMVKSYNEDLTSEIILLMSGMFILQLIFLSLGTALAAVSKNTKISGAVSTGIMLGTFILSMLIDLNDKLDVLKYITPFKYFDAKYLLENNSMDPVFVTISVILILSLITVTFKFYKNRDLNI
jgi:ABC-2 type transport system permease protein